MWNRKKMYKYITVHYSIYSIADEWSVAVNKVLNREGYRIEVEKIKERRFGTPIIYYYYVKEQSDVAED